ncbi:hypothetical protein FWY33_12160 [Escherichia coli]|nr:hypothetical protein [Escherichia coli]
MSIRELNLTKEQHDWLNGWLELWGAWVYSGRLEKRMSSVIAKFMESVEPGRVMTRPMCNDDDGMLISQVVDSVMYIDKKAFGILLSYYAHGSSTGSDTTLRDLRIRQNALVNSQVLKFLPPGPATDKDVEIVRQGAPTDMDNPETVARWLDAMANLERRNAQFNEFKAEWMSANGNPGQSRNGGQILGLDVKKGESLGSAVKRYMSMNTDAAPAQDSTPSGEPRNQVGSYTSKSGIQFTVE